ncbi:hypothetical protein [Sphingobium cupriresistens]|uniref:Uncharacterized protein n=1 Tax=Sphingobium cupriresistens TaxID=1132417 RepID=A0A8G1ZGQ1_9SPHN|nr:hypothetical protein [Sphingobium cupriresistens]RYM11748.1 hypothetical protein EWH12_08675 [Sphingobium cupriresistens]
MPARAIALGLGDGIGEARHNAVEIFSLHRNASFNAAVIRLNAFSCASVNVASALLWYGNFDPWLRNMLCCTTFHTPTGKTSA